MKKPFSLLVRNRPGVLSHVAGLITRRGYNVESIAAGPTENHEITRITVVVTGDENILDQVAKQLRKLIDVISVDALQPEEALTGELAIITINLDTARQGEIMNMVSILNLTVLDLQKDNLTVMAAGTAQNIDTVISGLTPFTIKAMARTGQVAISRPKP